MLKFCCLLARDPPPPQHRIRKSSFGARLCGGGGLVGGWVLAQSAGYSFGECLQAARFFEGLVQGEEGLSSDKMIVRLGPQPPGHQNLKKISDTVCHRAVSVYKKRFCAHFLPALPTHQLFRKKNDGHHGFRSHIIHHAYFLNMFIRHIVSAKRFFFDRGVPWGPSAPCLAVNPGPHFVKINSHH